ncbi:MAG TPA: pitrilysin family protein, partial [Bacilli bacterium]
MEALLNERVQETVYYEQLPNGLKVYILPKPGFSKVYATFTTKYGSIDNHFQVGDQEERRVPDGIAHFLEHKMFEEPEGDVFAQFASQGASANAFTSFDRTAYLFSSTGSILKNLKTLINFVQNPYFTDENVEKEKGIIGQEIQMYQDQAEWRSYFGLIEAMYQHHPVHIDIAGTIESISKITKDTLYDCYNTFYHPSNMCLFIVGGVETDLVMHMIQTNQANKTFAPQGEIKRFFQEEPFDVFEREKITILPVSLPKCMFGLKENGLGLEGELLLKRELTTKLIMDVMLGPSSPLFQMLYDENLISD